MTRCPPKLSFPGSILYLPPQEILQHIFARKRLACVNSVIFWGMYFITLLLSLWFPWMQQLSRKFCNQALAFHIHMEWSEATSSKRDQLACELASVIWVTAFSMCTDHETELPSFPWNCWFCFARRNGCRESLLLWSVKKKSSYSWNPTPEWLWKPDEGSTNID